MASLSSHRKPCHPSGGEEDLPGALLDSPFEGPHGNATPALGTSGHLAHLLVNRKSQLHAGDASAPRFRLGQGQSSRLSACTEGTPRCATDGRSNRTLTGLQVEDCKFADWHPLSAQYDSGRLQAPLVDCDPRLDGLRGLRVSQTLCAFQNPWSMENGVKDPDKEGLRVRAPPGYNLQCSASRKSKNVLLCAWLVRWTSVLGSGRSRLFYGASLASSPAPVARNAVWLRHA
ncbi:hypothetical protein DFH06DRAFT_521573 [Mycena polygramma]|nr:hypothetical protein DFH06DRAFT_521573 [Mycena polygramma]